MLTPHYIQIPTNAPLICASKPLPKYFLRNGQHSFRKRKKISRGLFRIYSYLLYVLQFATISSHLHKHAHIEFPNVPPPPPRPPPHDFPPYYYLYAQSDIPNVFISPAKNEIKRDENIFFPPAQFRIKNRNKVLMCFFPRIICKLYVTIVFPLLHASIGHCVTLSVESHTSHMTCHE